MDHGVPSGGSDSGGGSPGQHSGPRGIGTAQPHRAFRSQDTPQGKQGFRPQVLPQHAPDGPAVPKPESPFLASAGDGPGQTAPRGDGLSRPQLHPLQQDGALFRQGIFSHHCSFVENGPLPDGGVFAQNSSVEGCPLPGGGVFQQDGPLDHGPLAHLTAPLQNGVGANQTALPQRDPLVYPTGGHNI